MPTVHIRVLYLICETSHVIKNTGETKQRTQFRSEATTLENHKQDHNEPDHRQ